jgi:pilus assembly protein CpaC
MILQAKCLLIPHVWIRLASFQFIGVVWLAALALVALAQDRITYQAAFGNNQQPIKIDVQVGQTRIVDFDQAYERVSVSDNKVAEVVPVSERQILINGLAFGQINVVAWQKTAPGTTPKMLVFDVFVLVNLALIDNQIKILFPRENIQLSQVNNSVVLSGSVTRPELSEQVQKIIEATGLKVNNLIKAPILDAAQVQLQIRVAEVNRRVAREISTAYGFNNGTVPAFVSSGGPAQAQSNTSLLNNRAPAMSAMASSTVNLLLGNPASAGALGFIRALQSRGAIRELAEPNLIAMHGHKASFLAGGEYPVPIVQSVASGQNAITVIFKEFGIKLNFQPTILDENHIRLELEPEVSSLDFSSGVQIESLVIPGLRVRRAKTVLELRDGQSFALAGLIDNSEQVNLAKVPLLGDVPILGELFKSRSFQRNETELMFLVTVKTVEPLNPDQLPKLPGVTEMKPQLPANPTASLEGQAGHSIARPHAVVTKPNEQPLAATQPGTPVIVTPSAGPTGATGAQAKAPASKENPPQKKP